MALISNDWLKILEPEFSKPYYSDLYNKVISEYKRSVVYPPIDLIFNAFNSTSYNDVKVVIIGQDPYHEEGQAMGLAFSVNKGIKVPPSLVNIYKEMNDDVGVDIPSHGDLSVLAQRGVLLLNTVLTVRAHEANSHRDFGWETFTDAVIASLNNRTKPIVFMLWGAPAGAKEKLITNPLHLVLKAPHPSPLSAYRGFFGCKHFTKANAYLKAYEIEEINWQI